MTIFHRTFRVLCSLLAISGLALFQAHAEDDLGYFGFGTKPLVITVHGLNFKKLSCEEALVFNQAIGATDFLLKANVYACNFLEAQLSTRKFPDPGENYLTNDILRVMPDLSDSIVSFMWSGAIKDSRQEVERLKQTILDTAQIAKDQNRPLIIIAHSWGGALSLEALAEMDGDGTALANRLIVDKVVTLGTPVGGPLYQAAIRRVIPYQNFYASIPRAFYVLRMVNYHALRDAISSPLPIADEDILIDRRIDTATIESLLKKLLLKNVFYQDKTVNPKDELSQVYPPLSTPIWHSSYMENKTLPFPSIGADTLYVTLADDTMHRYFDATPSPDSERIRMLNKMYSE